MKAPAFFAAALIDDQTGDVLFYTGNAGAGALTQDRGAAFFAYSEAGAQRKAETLARPFGARYLPMTVQHGATVSTNPAKREKLNWNDFAGGTGAFNPSHNSYSARASLGTVYVDPPQRRGGSWAVRFSNDLGRVSGGLWRNIGTAKTALQGKKLAADFLETLASESSAYSSAIKQNPLVRVKVMSPPQRPAGNKGKPSKRLVKRRKVTAKAPRGVYANPASPAKLKAVPYRNNAKSTRVDDPAWIGYCVHRPASPSSAYAIFKTRAEAVEYAQELASKKGVQMAVSRHRYNVAQ